MLGQSLNQISVMVQHMPIVARQNHCAVLLKLLAVR